MKETKYKELLSKIDIQLNSKSQLTFADVCDISPALRLLERGNAPSGMPFITPGMDIDSLSQEKLYLVHTMLHSFYGSGGNKKLDKKSIEQLHLIIKKRIKHERFDKLDDKN